MATLTIRNLPDIVRDKLRVRASKVGRSMEAEARDILARSVLPIRDAGSVDELQSIVQSLYAKTSPNLLVQELIRERRREAIAEIIEGGEDPKAVLGENFQSVCREAGLTTADVQRMMKAWARSLE